MLMENMKSGKPLVLFVNREGYRYRLLSKVEYSTAGKVYITLIRSGNRVFRFVDRDEIELVYKDGDRMWKWNRVKGSVALLEGEKVHCLESLKEGESYNRREAFRVKLGAELFFFKLIPKEKEAEEASEEKELSGEPSEEDYEFIKIPCIIKDLSETGIGIYTDDKMDLGTLIQVNIPSKEGMMKMVGNVVRRESGTFGKYQEFYGCGFSQVDRKLRKYLFAMQRKQLQKERGKSR